MVETVYSSLPEELTPQVASVMLDYFHDCLTAKIKGLLHFVIRENELPSYSLLDHELQDKVNHYLNKVKCNTLHSFLEKKVKKGTKKLVIDIVNGGEGGEEGGFGIKSYGSYNFETLSELKVFCQRKGIGEEVFKSIYDTFSDSLLEGELSIQLHTEKAGSVNIVYILDRNNVRDPQDTAYSNTAVVEKSYANLEESIPALAKMMHFTGDWNDSLVVLKNTTLKADVLEMRWYSIAGNVRSKNKELFFLCETWHELHDGDAQKEEILKEINANDAFKSLIVNALENIPWTKENLQMFLENKCRDTPQFDLKLAIKGVDTITSGLGSYLHFETVDAFQRFLWVCEDKLGIDSQKLIASNNGAGNQVSISGIYTNNLIELKISNSYLDMDNQGKYLSDDVRGYISVETLYNFLTQYGWGKGSEKFNAIEF